MADKGLRYRFADWLSGGALTEMAARDYVLGPGSFSMYEQEMGRDKEQFSPAEYGNYIATSNAVYTCVTIRAELLASLPLRFYKLQAGQKVEVETGNLWDLFQKVNPYWTFSRLIKMTSYALDLWGVGFWFLERGEAGRLPPQEIWWAKPDRVEVVPHENNYVDRFLYYPPMTSNPVSFGPDEAIWIPNPNPIDEFSGLAPLAAARLAADVASAGMHSNKRIFDQGLLLGGIIMPPKDMTLSKEQAEELERNVDQRFAGQSKAHRVGVLRFAADIQTPALTPKDAEYLDGLKWSLEDVCRAYKIPLDLVGGQRTYENFDAALKAVWTNAIIPLSRFIAEEITEKMLPLYPTEADVAEFDLSRVAVLQEDRTEIVAQMTALWNMGVPLNPLLDEFIPSLLPKSGRFEWGDSWWAPISLMPVDSALPAAQPAPALEEGERVYGRQIEYNSAEHQRLWRIHERQLAAWERLMVEELRSLFMRQKDSVIDRLKRPKRSLDDAYNNPFDMPQWIKIFMSAIRIVLREIVNETGQGEFDKFGMLMNFDIDAPAVVQFMERQAQRFATEVNETTWKAIRDEIAKGLSEGEGIPALEKRLTDTFNDWAGVDPAAAEKLSRIEAIARTEVTAAVSGGQLEAWRLSGVVEKKAWLAAIDSRTRDSHIAAHDTYQEDPILLNQDFMVGDGFGPAPGLINRVEEVVNCRCTMQPIIRERALQKSNNGHFQARLEDYKNVKTILESI